MNSPRSSLWISHLIACGVGAAIGFAVSLALRAPADAPGGDRPEPALPGKLSALPEQPLPMTPSAPRPVGNAFFEGERLTGPVADKATFDAYLGRHRHSKEALIAVSLLSSDTEYLEEAARRYPDDPHVQLLVISRKALPGEQAEWIERFKASQPDNALASLFYGGDLLKQGETEKAIAQLRLAAGQPTFDDFSAQGSLATDAALTEFGYSALETKYRSTLGRGIPHLAEVNGTIRGLKDLALAAQDEAGKTELATIGIALGNHLSQGDANDLLINRVVGQSLEAIFLEMLDPELKPENFSATPGEMLEEIKRERATLKDSVSMSERVGELTEALA